jgi:pyruvate/2-oxoglutarate dehydrogenase complex dihydrolipoamide dehydrogenase (E3) component
VEPQRSYGFGQGKTMPKRLKVDIAIIGAGSGGLSVAAGAAQLGAKVVLIEKHKMGGDCLNYGCVPSKALIAAGEAAQAIRTSSKFGVNGGEPDVDFAKVNAHVHGVIGAIAPHDSVERFQGLGVDVIQAAGHFTDAGTLVAGDNEIKARRFVVATGSRPFVPPIAGLKNVPYLTNETVFDLVEKPEHLIIVGGGPIGLELAQAHRRLGSVVTVLEAFKVLPKDDPDAAAVVRARLLAEGVTIAEGAKVERVSSEGSRISVVYEQDGRQHQVEGTHLLVAAGRKPNVDGLGLEAAGIEYTSKGIKVDNRLRTTNKRVFAIGDVAGSYQFTHVASYHAGIVIRNVLFNFPAKADVRSVPWVTYTDPELAHVGLTEAQAKVNGVTAKSVSWSFTENDRAQAERSTEGFIKAVVGKGGVILGATIVGRHAGELLLPWVLAVEKRLKIKDMTSIIAPYPTLSEVTKRVSGAWFTPQLFSARTRAVVRLMQKIP